MIEMEKTRMISFIVNKDNKQKLAGKTTKRNPF
jgi:hypothetical protein